MAALLATGAFPYSAYLWCGYSRPMALPPTLGVGLYEEFPTADRLAKLAAVDFPVSLAVAAPSRAEFLVLRETISATYPQVRAIYFWPTLAPVEGYYPGTWSAGAGLRRAAAEAEGLPVLWDLEFPRGNQGWAPGDWAGNRRFLDGWLRTHLAGAPVHVWRSYAFLGLDSPLLRLAGMHFDPREYPQLWLHLDLYTGSRARPAWLMGRILRCGVERYGDRFVPALGVLDDGEGPGRFTPPALLARDLRLAREAGVSEVWVFGLNGLQGEYLEAVVRAGQQRP